MEEEKRELKCRDCGVGLGSFYAPEHFEQYPGASGSCGPCNSTPERKALQAKNMEGR